METISLLLRCKTMYTQKHMPCLGGTLKDDFDLHLMAWEAIMRKLLDMEYEINLYVI